MSQNCPKNPLIKILFLDLNPLIIGFGFECETEKVDFNDQRIKLYFKYKSRRLNSDVAVEVVAVPLMSFSMHCTAYVPALKDSLTIAFNWMRETRESVIKRFVNDFIIALIHMLSPSINDLPEELCLKLVSHLPYNSIIQLSQTSRFWRCVCDNDMIWRKKFCQQFSLETLRKAILCRDEWKKCFKNEYLREKERHRRRDPFFFLRHRSPLFRPHNPNDLRRTRSI